MTRPTPAPPPPVSEPPRAPYDHPDTLSSSPWATQQPQWAPARPPQIPGQPTPSAPLTYSPVRTTWAAPSGPPAGKKRKKPILIGSLIVVLVIALTITGLTFIPRLGWEPSDYGYDIVARKTVPAEESWTISLPLPTSSFAPADFNQWAGIVDIYFDEELKFPVPYVKTSGSMTITGAKGVFTPAEIIVEESTSLISRLTEPHFGNKNQWPTGTYYIAERQGLFGSDLERPRVRIYTVEGSSTNLVSPAFTMEASQYGTPLFTWTPVAHASAYYILKMYPSDLGGEPTVEVVGIADEKADSWLASSTDADFQNAFQNAREVTSYNSTFRASTQNGELCTAQDADYQGMEPPDWDDSELVYPSYAVVAVDAYGRTSFPVLTDGRQLTIDTPLAVALNTYEEMAAQGDPDLFLPETFPVTMGDCRTVFHPVQGQSLVSSTDKSWVTLTYSISGTLLSQVVYTGYAKSYPTIMDMGKKLNLRAVYQLGSLEDFTPMKGSTLNNFIEDKTIISTTPSSPYTWTGSTEMVTYIAAHLFAGTEAIDMSEYVADPTAPRIYDATNEAYFQNPYIIDFSPHIGIKDNVLYVSYETTPEEKLEAGELLTSKVDQVLASIISPGMSDRDKARAINKYLSTKAVYDNAALKFGTKEHTREEFKQSFPHSWNAIGVLIDGTGVCASYAAAFKLMAESAGLESMVVNGIADDSGFGHAWVKVKIDGKWRIVDPTWNSNLYEATGGNYEYFFALTDKQADRQQVNSFVIDSLIPSFDAI